VPIFIGRGAPLLGTPAPDNSYGKKRAVHRGLRHYLNWISFNHGN